MLTNDSISELSSVILKFCGIALNNELLLYKSYCCAYSYVVLNQFVKILLVVEYAIYGYVVLVLGIG